MHQPKTKDCEFLSENWGNEGLASDAAEQGGGIAEQRGGVHRTRVTLGNFQS